MSLRAAFLIVGSLVLAAACANGQPGEPGTSTALAEGDYLATSASTFAIVDGTVVRLGITGETFSISAGCNTLGSPFRVEDDEVVVVSLSSTMIGCAEDLANQDARLAAFLESRPVVTFSPDGFTLTGVDGTTLVFVSRAIADPDRAIEGTRWVLDAVVGADAAVSAVGFETVGLVLDAGTATITTGCSVGQASYALDGGELVLGALELTPVSGDDCSDGVVEAEAALVAVFGGTASATVQANALELRRSGVGLNFREG